MLSSAVLSSLLGRNGSCVSPCPLRLRRKPPGSGPNAPNRSLSARTRKHTHTHTPPPSCPRLPVMKLSVKISNDNTLSLTVPDNATVEDLKIAAVVALPPAAFPSIHVTPRNVNLWYSGHKLDYSRSLRSYNISPDTLVQNPNLVVHLTLDVSSSDGASPISAVPPPAETQTDSAILDDNEESEHDDLLLQQQKKTKKSKSKSKSRSKSKSKKCSFLNCTSAPLRMVGECQFCQGKFCSKHRLLESHNCKGLKICKDKCYERNAIKLQSEQTVASKV